MLRDDDIARTARANALIDEIARLERQQLAHAAAVRQLDDARHELAGLQPADAPRPDASPGLAVHLAVLATSAVIAFVGYVLLV
jgi:hypothetical protein